MIIGCKEYYECICPDFPDKCNLCGNFISGKETKMYKVQYKGKDGRWKNVRIKDNKIEFFRYIEIARSCMRRIYEIGYDARIVRPDGKWIEKMER